MTKRFINDDYKLKHGGRKAVRISKDELWNKIVKRAIAIGEDIEDDVDGTETYDSESAYQFVSALLYSDENIAKDIKFDVDRENIMFSEEEDDGYYVGMHTLENGLTFLGVLMGGDWETPVFLILYYDGKKIRSYVPSYGNCVNLDFKCAFGSEEDHLDRVNVDKLKKKYKKFVDMNPIEECELSSFRGWGEQYCRQYDTDFDGVEYNWDAIKEDIMARIELY